MRPLRVVIDARLRSGEWGGVEGVVTGLASGLSVLRDGPEEYIFVAWQGHESWLRPFISGPARLALEPPGDSPMPPGTAWRTRLAKRHPILAAALRSEQHLPSQPGPHDTNPFVEQLEPDIAHLTLQQGLASAAPSIYHPHDLQHVHLPEFFTEEERRRRELWYGTLCRSAAMVAVASSWTKRDVEQYFQLRPEKVRVVPLAPPIAAYVEPDDTEAAAAMRRLRLPEAFVLYPAQTWPHKNHIALLSALADVRDRYGLIVPLVAPGHRNAYFPELERRAQELGIGSQVRWLGFVDGSDLRALYKTARAVIVPTKFEAASGPLWEAFVVGVPAACSNVTSLPDQAGDAALLFDPDDITQMADAIHRLWTDDKLRVRLVVAAKRRVSSFTWDRTARTFRAHYRRLARRSLSDEDLELLTEPPPI